MNWFQWPPQAWRIRAARREAAQSLSAACVEQARLPVFYAQGGVADSLDGRFDLVTIHAFLLLRRLRGRGPAANPLNQAIFDALFARFDENLREMGVGDLSIAKRMRAMSESFFGRVGAYESALNERDDDVLKDALRRNLYRGRHVPDALLQAMATYMRQADKDLAAQNEAELQDGRLRFPEPPDFAVSPGPEPQDAGA